MRDVNSHPKCPFVFASFASKSNLYTLQHSHLENHFKNADKNWKGFILQKKGNQSLSASYMMTGKMSSVCIYGVKNQIFFSLHSKSNFSLFMQKESWKLSFSLKSGVNYTIYWWWIAFILLYVNGEIFSIQSLPI